MTLHSDTYWRVPEGSIFGPTHSALYINELPNDVVCNIAIYGDNTTLSSKCNQASDLWQQLELASELESDGGRGGGGVQIRSTKWEGLVKWMNCSKKGRLWIKFLLLIYMIYISILCVPQEGLSLIESNQQVFNFSKWAVIVTLDVVAFGKIWFWYQWVIKNKIKK